jgi:hypothetical protein
MPSEGAKIFNFWVIIKRLDEKSMKNLHSSVSPLLLSRENQPIFNCSLSIFNY